MQITCEYYANISKYASCNLLIVFAQQRHVHGAPHNSQINPKIQQRLRYFESPSARKI